jgi:hypothetical protein
VASYWARDTKMSLEDKLFKKALEIRNNWKDTEKLKVLVDAWDMEFGHDYDDIVEQLLGPFLEETWKKKAEEHGSNSLEDLLGILLDWPEAKCTKEKIDGGYKVTTTHCPIAASYTAIGRGGYGASFHCISDPYICRGFNNKIRHRKISSRMQGDDACVHFYAIDDE